MRRYIWRFVSQIKYPDWENFYTRHSLFVHDTERIMPWSQMPALENLKYNGEVDNMDLPYLPWLCKMTSCVVYCWQAKKKKEGKWKTTH